MALLTKVGTFHPPSSLGTQVISGIGFQPKTILFYSVSKDGDSSDNSCAACSYGFTSGPSAQTSYAGYGSSHGSFTVRGVYSTSHAIRLHAKEGFESASTLDGELVSLNGDGFTLIWTRTGSQTLSDFGDIDIHYLALGGDDVLGVKLDWISPRTGKGTQVISGVGFKPNTTLFLPMYEWNGTEALSGFGVATPSGQWGWGASIQTNVSSRNTTRRNYTGLLIQNADSQALVTSFDSDGFTLNWTDSPHLGYLYPYLAMEMATPPISGEVILPSLAEGFHRSVAGFEVTPKAMLFDLWHTGMTSTPQDNYAIGTGLTDGSTQVAASFGLNSTLATGGQKHGRSLYLTSHTARGEVQVEAASTFDADGFSLDLIQNDNVKRQLLYLAFVDSTSTGETQDGIYALPVTSAATFSAVRTRTDSAYATAIAQQTSTGTSTYVAGAMPSATSDLATVAFRSRGSSADLEGNGYTSLFPSRTCTGVITLDGLLDASYLASRLLDCATDSGADLLANYLGTRVQHGNTVASGNLDLSPYGPNRLRVFTLDLTGSTTAAVYVQRRAEGSALTSARLGLGTSANASFTSSTLAAGDLDAYVIVTRARRSTLRMEGSLSLEPEPTRVKG